MTDQDIGCEPWLAWLPCALLPLVASVFVPNGHREVIWRGKAVLTSDAQYLRTL